MHEAVPTAGNAATVSKDAATTSQLHPPSRFSSSCVFCTNKKEEAISELNFRRAWRSKAWFGYDSKWDYPLRLKIVLDEIGSSGCCLALFEVTHSVRRLGC